MLVTNAKFIVEHECPYCGTLNGSDIRGEHLVKCNVCKTKYFFNKSKYKQFKLTDEYKALNK